MRPLLPPGETHVTPSGAANQPGALTHMPTTHDRWLRLWHAVRQSLRVLSAACVRHAVLASAARMLLAAAGVLIIAYVQVQSDFVEAPLFVLFFWCLLVTRFFGVVPAVTAVACSTFLGNVLFLPPLGHFSLAASAGVFSVAFACMALTSVAMFASIKRDVRTQRLALRHEQHMVRAHASLAQALRAALRSRDTFLAIAGHELKSPVTALLLQAESWRHRLAKRVMPTDMQRDGWQRQIQHLQRLIGLVDGLLDVSRLSHGQLRLHRTDVDFAEVVADVISRLQDAATRAACPVRVDVPQAVHGQWDRLRLEQVVENLLSNAFKYGAGQPIDVVLRQEDELAVLRVQDHGAGISAADQKRIFECYERAEDTSHIGGLGLGLWIVRQIVEANGGDVQVHSEHGQGAQFVVSLPC